MRTMSILLAGLFMGLSQLAAPPAEAQAQPRPAGEACQGRRALGVSRTIAVDATQGPRFGHQQYKELSFLQDGEVVLTFDDGPLRQHTRAVLEALDSHCTKATFFMVGRMALSDPEMVREVARRGHTVATHTFTHKNLRATNQANARHEIELGFSAVQKAAGTQISPFFRFPYLSDPAHVQSYLQSRNIAMFSIEVDAYDYRTQSPDQMHRTVMAQLAQKSKGIILWHDIQPSTAGGVRRLLDDMAAKGYRVVHVVPKQPVQTLPEFDAMADRELSRRKMVVAAQPLAPRAVTWAMGPPPSTTIGVGNANAASVATVRPASASQLPRLPSVPPAPMVASTPPPPLAVQPTPFAAPAPPPIERPRRLERQDRSWQDRAFGTN